MNRSGAPNPLHLLLRGCTRTTKATPPVPANTRDNGIDNPVSETTADSSQLCSELDFFASRAGSGEKAPTKIQTSPSPNPAATIEQPVSTSNGSNGTNNTFPKPDPNLLNLIQHPKLRTALASIGVTSATPIQRRAIPAFNAGHDVVGIAPTGSGKTLAYALPLLAHILSSDAPRAGAPATVVVAPTRELAHQICQVFTRLNTEGALRLRITEVTTRAALAALGGSQAVHHVIVATPMRLAAAAKSGALSLGSLKHIVLDEADELLSEKFLAQVDALLNAAGISSNRGQDGGERSGPRVHLFSATLPSTADDVARALLGDMKKVVVDAGDYGGAAAVNRISEAIEQRFVFVGGRGEQGKVMAVRGLLKEGLKPPVLIFVQSKERAAELFRELIYDGVNVDAIHGDRTVAARTSAIERFRAGKLWLLIATDILARGLDFLCVNTIINYDMPASATAYVHRIGRTGRNGRSGCAITLFTEEDKKVVGPVVRIAKASGAELPEWLVKLGSKVRADEARRFEKRPPKRRRVGGPNRTNLKGGKKKKRKRGEEDTGNAGKEADE